MLKYIAIASKKCRLPPLHRAESSIITMLRTPAVIIPAPTSAPLQAALPEVVADTFVQPDEALAGGAVMLEDKVKSAHLSQRSFQ